jgi:hypothetical protein
MSRSVKTPISGVNASEMDWLKSKTVAAHTVRTAHFMKFQAGKYSERINKWDYDS